MFASALLIVVADALIKKVSEPGSYYDALTSPWMLIACVLYLIQIVLAVFVFINHGELAVYANLYIVFYSLLMVAAAVVIFREQLTGYQIIGIVLALAGAFLINGYRFGQ